MDITLTRPASRPLPPLVPPRYALIWLPAIVYLAISGLTRLVLAAIALRAGQVGVSELPAMLASGTGNDLLTAMYLAAPGTLYLMLLPLRIYRAGLHRVLVWSVLGLALFGMTYLAVVEYFFFDEFNARFNFVAVEYLIYPHEVFVNIWESYPVVRAVLLSIAASACLLALLFKPVAAALDDDSGFRRRVAPALALFAGLALAHFGTGAESDRTGHNRVADEIAANGVYSFFDAAINNHLDYTRFYFTIDDAEAVARARRLVAQPNAQFIPGAANPLARHVSYAGAPKRLHVIVLLQESLGAEFIGAYGAARSLTPNLDRIAEASLVFTNTYATGTRTVRGMEAVTASFPPVPAEAIVKRRRNEHMFNWSTIMRENGYSPTFIYGGYGTFDNMNHFFANNGYRVIDRADMDRPHFANIWGVSDEDLFRNALQTFDRQHASGERIFSIIMTTSNHKPFTFPEGVEGVRPRGGGREAGVRYADYAMGRFIDELRKRPYFDDTMVVIVADHGARVYGREDIPLPSYEIPFIVYSPRHVEPRRVDVLTSQIDVAPTVLGLLNLTHDSVFFGKDVLAAGASPHLALLNHNRDIALYSEGRLHELGFRGRSATLFYDRAARQQRPAPSDEDGIRDAASVFQLAYELYRRGQYRLD
jgi:phosphoglycerol transferase MdoB-like AlkP superfamily enzyme